MERGGKTHDKDNNTNQKYKLMKIYKFGDVKNNVVETVTEYNKSVEYSTPGPGTGGNY